MNRAEVEELNTRVRRAKQLIRQIDQLSIAIREITQGYNGNILTYSSQQIVIEPKHIGPLLEALKEMKNNYEEELEWL